MKIEDCKKANELILEMQRIEETIDHLYGEKIEVNKDEYRESWRVEINGFSTTLSRNTFNIIVDSLRDAYKKAQSELENL